MKLAIDKIVKILGIDLADTSTLAFMGEDIIPLKNDINSFVEYVRNNCNSHKLNYKDGFQKFIFLVDEYKKNKIALSHEEQLKIHSYSNDLNNKIIIIFELFNEELNKNKVSLDSQSAKKYFSLESVTKNLENYLGQKGLMVVDAIGRINICKFVKYNRYSLLEEIKETITSLAKNKKSIVLGYSLTAQIGARRNELVMNKRASL
jgi:hypothetical protein